MDLAPSDVVLRPFGKTADLDVDFGQSDRPGLVTTLLAQCAQPHDPAFWWAQPVGERTAALLRLVALTEQREEFRLSARCTSDACRELFEFQLPIGSLPNGTAGNRPLQVQLDRRRALTIRRPTGEDLRRWRDARPASPIEALRLMLDSLLIAGEARPEDEAALSESIAAMDPLVDFVVSCRCPACGAPNDVAVDLEALALGSLANRQRALLQDVHFFASHYGWTESEVLAVPTARRACYLALIEGER